MSDLGQAARLALEMIAGLDGDLLAIVGLSLKVSFTATVIAFVIGSALGTGLALIPFPGRRGVVILTNALLGLPPVVVGLLVYLLLSRSGPLGPLGLLFTPAAMIVAQAVLGTPIVAALVHRAVEGLWREFGDAFQIDGASPLRAGRELLVMARTALLTAFLAAFGRAIAEVGAILVVGGNIRGATRTMTTAIALETSKGDLALALGLGLILISLSLAVSFIAFSLDRWTEKAA